MTFDVKKRLDEMRGEWAKLTGQGEHSTPPPGRTFEGMTVGDLLEWSDPWVEADYPNTLTNARRLTGKIVHMHGHPRWGWGLKIQLIDVPEGDPLKVDDEVFRWGDRLKWDGKIKRLPMIEVHFAEGGIVDPAMTTMKLPSRLPQNDARKIAVEAWTSLSAEQKELVCLLESGGSISGSKPADAVHVVVDRTPGGRKYTGERKDNWGPFARDLVRAGWFRWTNTVPSGDFGAFWLTSAAQAVVEAVNEGPRRSSK